MLISFVDDINENNLFLFTHFQVQKIRLNLVRSADFSVFGYLVKTIFHVSYLEVYHHLTIKVIIQSTRKHQWGKFRRILYIKPK